MHRVALVSAQLLRRLGSRGAVAIVTALCAPVLALLVGFIADYGYASYINQRLARATDAATVGAVSQTAATAAGGYGNTTYLQTLGQNYFTANTSQLGLTGANYTLSVASDGTGGVTATGTYSMNVPTFFAGLLGRNNIAVSGTAKTAARPLVYINYYVLVDTSQSMGIAATQADMDALYLRVKNAGNASSNDVGCVFGCHVLGRIPTNSSPNKMQTITNEALAHDTRYGTPITLRIDSAVSAIQSIVASAAQISAITKNVKFGLYGIGQDPATSKSVKSILDPPSNDYSAVSNSASTIDLGNTDGTVNRGDTDFSDEFSDFLAGGTGITPPSSQGSGASTTSPLNYIFVVTDGLTDVTGNCPPYNVCTSPIDASTCAPLKAKATVGVIYTTYIPIYQFNTAPTLETRYSRLVDGKTDQIRTALTNCASSPEWFFEAQDGPAITTAMQALFLKTQPTSARLSQ